MEPGRRCCAVLLLALPLVILGLSLTVPARTAYAATINVTTTADEINVDGDCSLREAIQAANLNVPIDNCGDGDPGMDTINVPTGDYILTLTPVGDDLNLSGDLDVLEDLTLIGSGLSDPNLSKLLGGVAGGIADRFLDLRPNVHLRLERIVMIGGNVTGDGGAIRATTATIDMLQCRFQTNTASGNGGAISMGAGNLTFTFTAFFQNTAGGNGGAISMLSGQVSGGTLVTGNRATGNGGAIDANAANVSLSSLSLRENSAGLNGGAVASTSGEVSIGENAEVRGNTAGGVGGAVFTDSGPVEVFRGVIGDNTATSGGFLHTTTGPVDIQKSTLRANSATNGGVIRHGGAATVTNSTFSANIATGNGAAIYTTGPGGALTAIHTTFAEGSAASGGAVYVDGGTASFRASILDTGPNGANCGGPIAVTSQGSNVADDTSCGLAGSGDLQVAAGGIGLGPLSGVPLGFEYYPPLPGSPAIDIVVGACAVTSDERNVVRPKDGNADGTASCDAGSIEAPGVGRLDFSAAAYDVNEGVSSATVIVARTNGTEGAVSVTVGTTDATATAPADYAAIAQAVSFEDGEGGNKTVQVSIVNDAIDEAVETVNLALNNPIGQTLLGAQRTAVLSIQDDDPSPSLSIDDVTVAEGNSGPAALTFTVSLTGPPSQQVVTVGAQTVAGGSATPVSDYTPVGATTLTFPAGVTSQTFSVPVLGDAASEGPETVLVSLTNPVNATIGKDQGTGTITNDDGEAGVAALWIYDASVAEGNGGTTALTFIVELNRVSQTPVTVQYSTANSSATTDDGDYQPASGTLTINPGDLSTTLTIAITGDTRPEANEALTIALTNPTGAGIAKAQAVGTIQDDDLSTTACSPRPPVTVASRSTGDGRLEVTVTAGTQGPNGANRLIELRFGAGANALVDVAGQSGRSGAFTVALPERPISVTFFVRRASPGQGTTVPLTVVDTCGEWPTLVGGGPGAF